MDNRSGSLERLCAGACAFVVWFALLLQLYLTVGLTMADGRGVVAGVIAYLTFFTILTNILVALTLTLPLVANGSWAGAFAASPFARTGVASYITIVGIVYSVALRHIWDPQGAQRVADVILHDASPVLLVAFWLLFVPKGQLRPGDAVRWLLYPLAYIAATVVRGAIVHRYPYPFIDVTALGYPRALANTVGLTFAFLVTGLLYVAVDRALGSRASARDRARADAALSSRP
jgi:hypothetical protein